MEPCVTFQVSEVPVHLHKSAFYKSLNSEDEDSITLPTTVFKQDTTVNSVDEANHLLSTLQFWDTDCIPTELMHLFHSESPSTISKLLDKFNQQFATIHFLRSVNRGDDAQRVNFVLTKGKISLVKRIIASSPEWDRGSACKHAAISGSLECLTFMHELGGILDHAVCAVAVRGGFIECFKYAYENSDVELDTYFTRCAVEGGHLIMLKYLRSLHCPWDTSTTRGAAESNHLSCLQYAHEEGCEWNTEVAAGAAANGRLEILMYLRSEGCPWDALATQNAAYHGQLECLHFLHAHQCPWNRSAPAYAALRGNFECLKFLYENGCPWDALTTTMAAERNNLEMITFAHERGCRISPTVYRWAARYGNIEMMRFAHEQGVEWEHDSMTESSKCGSLECLMFAHQCGGIITVHHAHFAAAGGHLSCLEYVLSHLDLPAAEAENGSVGATCLAAAENGHLECLIYAHTHGCTWTETICKRAAGRGQVECVKYVIAHGCAYDKKECYTAAASGRHTLCMDYLLSLSERHVRMKSRFTCGFF